AFVGTMLNIKPVLHVDDEGHLIPVDKVRGRRKSLEELVAHMEKTAIVPAVLEIGAITFIISFLGVVIGHQFGTRFKRGAEIAGGAVLILIGLKILLEHLGILG
ncbi:MAG TPA: DegV family protein, partial [Candidatus Limiplasma sp.]|nr:DegV family protein [Candidatus Limiplasma sp.]